MNLRSIPGTTYPIGERFTLLPMPDGQPLQALVVVPHGARRRPKRSRGASLWLHFDGINYRANVWVNGTRIAHRQGSGRRLPPLRVRRDGRSLRPGERNAVAVEVFAPEPHDLAIMWVDWNPTPAGQEHGPVGRRLPHATAAPSRCATRTWSASSTCPSLDTARLTVTAEVWNTTDRP